MCEDPGSHYVRLLIQITHYQCGVCTLLIKHGFPNSPNKNISADLLLLLEIRNFHRFQKLTMTPFLKILIDEEGNFLLGRLIIL